LKFLIVTDAYFPNNSSVSVLLSDLAQEFIAQSIDVDILVSVSEQDTPIKIWNHNGCEVISIKALKTKDISYFRRTINEFINPWLIWRTLEKSPGFMSKQYDGVIWYSPTIFWGPLIKRLRYKFQCRSYLILRDIFPDWALHVGVLKKGLVYSFFKMAEQYQYRQADCIGVQSPNNLKYFQKHNPIASKRAQVLWNWASKFPASISKPCSIDISNTLLKDKIVFVYAGNLGVAQGGSIALFEMAKKLRSNANLGILVVGRGSAINALRDQIAVANLNNILVFDEIDSAEMPALLEQCHVGLVFLDRRHQTHNIPGKFITYLQSGLPVLAWVNPGNDLVGLISNNSIGISYADEESAEFAALAIQLVAITKNGETFHKRCEDFHHDFFLISRAAKQILQSLAA
jgi:glycosyltransferase involved in cell wall biosynthesis